jgi:RimJ/RimL family protein N-acetyltransferase
MITLATPATPTTAARNGLPLNIRPLDALDLEACTDFLTNLSPRTRRLRYFLPSQPSPAETKQQAAQLLARSANQHTTLVVTPATAPSSILALGELVLDPQHPDQAEIALVVRDEDQRQGIGQALIHGLATVATAQHLHSLHAYTLEENIAIPRLIKRLGLPYHSETSHGLTTLTINLPEAISA